MPRTDSPTVNVRARLPGASAEEIETTITKPIEASVNTINGIDELRCSSSQGNGNCTITFTLERDIEAATQDVRDKVATVALPARHAAARRQQVRSRLGADPDARRLLEPLAEGDHARSPTSRSSRCSRRCRTSAKCS